MKCLMCESLSLKHICSSCQDKFLQPSLYRRKIEHNIEVISFYKYEEIKELLHTKHTDIGYYIYNILAKLSFKKFADEFHTKEKFVSICIDDKIDSGYSHVAILNKYLSTYNIKPKFNKIRAQNSISYSGKNKEFRLLNSRDFQLNKFKQKNVILVDDIITTGSTLNQAVELLRENHKEILFCLTLSDVNQK